MMVVRGTVGVHKHGMVQADEGSAGDGGSGVSSPPLSSLPQTLYRYTPSALDKLNCPSASGNSTFIVISFSRYNEFGFI